MLRRFGTRKLTGLATLAIAGVATASTYAFTATNTVSAHNAGVGVATVSPFTVTDQPSYTFSPDGTGVESVTFHLNQGADDVAVALTVGAPSAAADWKDCGKIAASPYLVTCTWSSGSYPSSAFTKFNVAAVGDGTGSQTVTIGS